MKAIDLLINENGNPEFARYDNRYDGEDTPHYVYVEIVDTMTDEETELPLTWDAEALQTARVREKLSEHLGYKEIPNFSQAKVISDNAWNTAPHLAEDIDALLFNVLSIWMDDVDDALAALTDDDLRDEINARNKAKEKAHEERRNVQKKDWIRSLKRKLSTETDSKKRFAIKQRIKDVKNGRAF